VQQRRSDAETPTAPFGRPSLTMPNPLAIFDRIAAGDVAGCAATLAQGGSWDVTDDDGTTPLESAVRAGNIDITRLLLDAGAPPNSAMFVALGSCNDRAPEAAAPVLEALLQAGADANWKDDGGRSALYQGVKHAPLVRALLAHGAAPNSATSAGETPLSFACDWGLLESVELLLDAGADPRQAMPELDWPPLFFAAQGGHVDIARALLDAGADPGWANARGQNALDVALDHGRGAVAHLLLDQQPGLASGDTKALAAEARRKADERLARRIEALARRGSQEANSLRECGRALERARAALDPGPEPFVLVSATGDESSRLRRWTLRFKPRAWLPADDKSVLTAGGGVVVRVELDGDTVVSHDD
jgi:ankyrin repeat protein